MNFRYSHGERPLDGYTIKRGVGRGGFGEVYYAVSDGGREVALKSIFFNPDIELRGVRQCINLKSPYLVSIFDVRHGSDGTPFVIMEYVTGPSLRDLLRDNPQGLGDQKAAFLVREIAKGLAYLHERGIVHRDLKPENIFYEEGFVKIGDYGLSKFINASQQSGQTISVGTVHYMAPEIGSGNYHRGIDIYALGIMLYEFLTGDVPFTGDSFGEILMKHLTVDPDLNSIAEPFSATILKAVAKKPAGRFENAEEMAAALLQNDALNTSVSVFNPASLSHAAKKFQPAETIDASDSPAPPDVEPKAADATGEAWAQDGRAGADRGVRVAKSALDEAAQGVAQQPAKVEEVERFDRFSSAPGNGAAGTRRFDPDPAAARSLDVLGADQRWFRFLFIGGLSMGAVAFLTQNSEPAIRLFFTAGGGALAVYITEFFLRPTFQISRGLGWQLVAGLLAALPLTVGAMASEVEGRYDEGMAGALIVSMLCISWGARLRPTRDERISASQAVTASMIGAFFGLCVNVKSALFVGSTMATISLLVNSFSPFTTRQVRSLWQRYYDGHGTRPEPERPIAAGPQQLSGYPPTSVRPGTAARFFWVMVGCGLLASGICLVIYCGMIGIEHRDFIETLFSAEALMGYAGFAFYRGLWAWRRGWWGRTVRPFLFFSLFNVAMISATGFVFGSALDRWGLGPDNSKLYLSFLVGSTMLVGVLLLLDQFLLKFRVQPAKHLPRHLRPVGPLTRLFYGALAVGSGLWAASVVFTGEPDKTFEFLPSALLLGAFALFSLRQAVRQRCGHLWSGLLRPFFLTGSGALLVIGCLPHLYSVPDGQNIVGDMDSTTLLFLSIFAAVFGLGVYFLRGSDEVPEQPLRDHLRTALRPGSSLWAMSSWSALAAVLWILGLAMGFLTWVVKYGGLNTLGSRWPEWVQFVAWGGEKFALGLILFGALCVVLGRLSHGLWATVRGVIAQLALVVAVSVLPYIATGPGGGAKTLAVGVVLGCGGVGLLLTLRTPAVASSLQPKVVTSSSDEPERVAASRKEA